MSDIRNTWLQIESWLAAYAPEVLEQLQPPAHPTSTAALERLIGRPLPPDLAASLQIHDGSSPHLGLLGSRELLSVSQMRLLWQTECARLRGNGPGRIPIAADSQLGNSYYLFLDAEGAVVASWRTGADRLIVADSFGAFLQALATDMAAGHVALEGEHLVFSPASAFTWPPPGPFLLAYR